MADSLSTAILVTDIGDGGHAHYRHEEQQPSTDIQQVRVLCGRLIIPAPLVAPIGPKCRDCMIETSRTDIQSGPEPSLRRCLRTAAGLWRSARTGSARERT
jgi:hypothetical protein